MDGWMYISTYIWTNKQTDEWKEKNYISSAYAEGITNEYAEGMSNNEKMYHIIHNARKGSLWNMRTK